MYNLQIRMYINIRIYLGIYIYNVYTIRPAAYSTLLSTFIQRSPAIPALDKTKKFPIECEQQRIKNV